MRGLTNSLIFAAGISVALASGLQAKVAILNPLAINPGGPMIPAKPPKRAGGQASEQPTFPALSKLDLAKIKADIKALNSGRPAVREKAANDLLAMGEPVVPYIKAALKGFTTPEMRHLLRRDERAIARIALMRGPLITLNLRSVSAAQAIQDVCRQAGVTASNLNGMATTTVALDVKNAPFWQVIAALARRSGLSPSYGYMNNAQMTMQFSQGQNTIGRYTSFDGAFAVSLASGNYQRSCDYTQAKPQRSSSFTFQANLLLIPTEIGNVQVQPVVLKKALDANGQSLLAPDTANFNGNFAGAVIGFNFNLNYPRHPARRIKIIEGYIPITASVGRKKYVIHISTKKTEHLRIDGVRLKIGPESLVNNSWQFPYTISWPRMESPDVQSIQSQLSNTACMTGTSATGVMANYINIANINSGPNQSVYTMQTNARLAKLTIMVYTQAANLKIPFKFTNVPMP